MPWNRDGARHAHVDCHRPVPRVMPVAIKAPTLCVSVVTDRASAAYLLASLLVKVIQHTDAPCTPAARESFRKIDTSGDA